ncbi:MAG TPA: methyltransferase domain-containing protein [Fibrobacteria bacterium]|nr:methyltransferase domain-containing protein [Fibrobacteria bacterium]
MIPAFITRRISERRRQRFLSKIDSSQPGLEIGPCHNGIARKEAFPSVKILDHLDQAGLVAKYSSHAHVDVSKIEPVDFVWSGEPLPDLVGSDRFHWIIASHVIEHVPDPIRFIQQCLDLLVPGGVLLLAVPDRRRTFDFLRPSTGTGEIVDAFVQKSTRPTPGQVAEHFLSVARKGSKTSWPSMRPGPTVRIHSVEEARQAFQQASECHYVDVHIWKFSPESFREVFADVHRLGLLPCVPSVFASALSMEFFAVIQRN